MPDGKTHGMTGKANASKNRGHWPKSTLQISPENREGLKRHNVRLVDGVNDGVEMLVKKLDTEIKNGRAPKGN